MIKHLLHTVVLIGFIVTSFWDNAYAGYEDIIPPEILRLSNPEIIKKQIPIVVSITQPMIWGLRDKPDLGGDVYSFDLAPFYYQTNFMT